jgi:predicted MFS family arabinose efflux permease
VSVLSRHPAFRRLWAAGAVSLVGDWLSFVAVAVLAVQGGGGPFALALVFAAHALPGAILSPVAGALVDGADRRRVLIAADLGAAALTIAMTIAAAAGALVAIAPLLLVRSAVVALVPPGESAAVRALVPERDLLPANAILAATWSVAYVAGMALGGAAALLGPALALALDAASFAIAAAIHATLPALPAPAGRRSLVAIVRETPRDTAAALRIAAAHPPLLRAVMAKAPLGLAGGAAWVAINLIAADTHPFGAAALSYGILQAIRGAGTGVGPAIAARMARAGFAERALQAGAVALAIVAIPALALAHGSLALALVCLAWGTGTGANWVLAHTALQREASNAVIGRLAAFDELLVVVAMVASAFLGAAVIDALGLAAAPPLGAALGLAGVAAAFAIGHRTAAGARRSATTHAARTNTGLV